MQKLNYVKIPSWCKCTFKNRAARRIALRLYQTSSINSSKEIRVDYAQSNTTILTSIINIIRYQQQLHSPTRFLTPLPKTKNSHKIPTPPLTNIQNTRSPSPHGIRPPRLSPYLSHTLRRHNYVLLSECTRVTNYFYINVFYA